MMLSLRSLKITPTHLERKAVVYIRQSTRHPSPLEHREPAQSTSAGRACSQSGVVSGTDRGA